MKVDKVVVRFIVFITLGRCTDKTQKKPLRLERDGYSITIFFNREVAQLVSAPGLGPGGRRFESCFPYKFLDSSVVEQTAVNRWVPSSNLGRGAKKSLMETSKVCNASNTVG
jgi:hypothetical protein